MPAPLTTEQVAETQHALTTHPTVRLAAQALGIATQTLNARIRNYGLTRPTGRTPRQPSDASRLRQALAVNLGHVARTAELLGVSTEAIYDRARRHGIGVGGRWVRPCT
jgi:transcriptional regulator of acetoin/glycerol metabolism